MQCTRPVTLDAGQTEATHVWPQGQGAISCRFLSLPAAKGTGCNGAQEYCGASYGESHGCSRPPGFVEGTRS